MDCAAAHLGWRHFQVVNRTIRFLNLCRMVAACEPFGRFWVNARALKDDTLWLAGWKSLTEQRQSSQAITSLDPKVEISLS